MRHEYVARHAEHEAERHFRDAAFVEARCPADRDLAAGAGFLVDTVEPDTEFRDDPQARAAFQHGVGNRLQANHGAVGARQIADQFIAIEAGDVFDREPPSSSSGGRSCSTKR